MLLYLGFGPDKMKILKTHPTWKRQEIPLQKHLAGKMVNCFDRVKM